MPTVEDYFDDDSDLPLPSSSSSSRPGGSGSGNRGGGLQGSGLQGALLEEISTDDPDVPELDYDLLADQGRGVYGENAKAPPPGSGNLDKGKMVARDDAGDLRPSAGAGAGGPNINPNSMMGGFMGDMMKLQKAEDERMEKLRKQMGGATIAGDPSVYKGWNSVYPIYFDAKKSVSEGRRVSRKNAMWWPQASQISQACRALLIPSVIEPEKTHPADWENPGRVKVQFEQDGRFHNPIIKNRTQLYQHIGQQLRRLFPDLSYVPAPRARHAGPSTSTATSGAAKSSGAKASVPSGSKSKSKSGSKAKKAQSSTGKSATGKAKSASSINKAQKGQLALKSTSSKSNNQQRFPPPSRPPRPSRIPHIDNRLPLHSPITQTGVAVSAVKRDIENEKEAKKKGGSGGAGNALGGGGAGQEDGVGGGSGKQPKMKRIVVRGKR